MTSSSLKCKAHSFSKMLKALVHLIRSSKGNQGNRSWRGEGREKVKKTINREKIFLYICTSVYKISLKMRGQWIQIAENKILVTCGLQYFLLSLSFFFGVNRFFNCELLHNLLHHFVRGLKSVTLSGCSCPPHQMLHTVSRGLEFYCVPTKMDRSSVCPGQVLPFYTFCPR